jgi:hypothetical protein
VRRAAALADHPACRLGEELRVEPREATVHDLVEQRHEWCHGDSESRHDRERYGAILCAPPTLDSA